MFPSLGRIVYRHRIAILVLYGVVLGPLLYLSVSVFDSLRAGGFEVPGSESHEVFRTLEKEINVGGADILALWTSESGTIDDIEAQVAAYEALDRIEKDPSVVSTASWYKTQAPQLINKERNRTFLLIALSGDDQDKADALKRLTPLLEAPPLKLQLGGIMPVNVTVQRIVAADLKRAELFAFPITAIVLLLIFGSGASAALPLLLGAMSIVLSLSGLRILTFFGPVSIFAVNIVSLLGLGLAIDYSLFLVNRYREELLDHDTETALVRAISTTGRAVAFSGITVAASLVGLFFFPQMFLRSMATGGILVTLGTVILSLTLLPALLAVLGKRVDAWRIPFAVQPTREAENTFWHKVAVAVMRRPVVVAVGVIVPLIVVGLPFARFDPSFPDYRVLPPDEPAYIANDILHREFSGDQMTPVDVLCEVKGNALSKENLEKLWQVSNKLVHIADGRPDLAKPALVSGLFTLVPGVPKETIINKLATPDDILEKEDPTVLMGIKAFAKGNYMRFALLIETPYNEAPALKLVDEVRNLHVEGVDIKVGGAGAYLTDMKRTLVERSPWMIGLVVIVMFVVLFLVFGSVTLPIKAMLMNALSLSASFGAIVWVFQDGRFSDVLDYVPLGISDCTAPLLMFSIVFGLSMDYEVLILSRVREEYDRTGDNDAAVAIGLARTGRLITSAALLLVIVIGAFGTSHIIFMKSLGVGMALAVALDATVIRALLVPAAMKLMGDWNWWAPAPLLKLWKKIGMSGEH